MKVAFDIDGVLADFRAACCDKLGLDITQWVRYNFYENKYPPDLIRKIEDELMQDLDHWLTLPVIHGAAEAVQSLIEAGVDVYFITAAHSEWRPLRYNWLLSNISLRIEYDHLIHCKTKDKPRIAQDLGVTYMLDDRLSVVTDTWTFGVHGCLMDTPYRWDGQRPISWLERYVHTPKSFAEMLLKEQKHAVQARYHR